MMRLTYPLFDHPIELEENTVNIIVLESPKCFRTFLFEIKELLQKSASKLCLSKDFEELSFDRFIHVVFSLELLDINNRKILGKILSNLKEFAYSEEMYEKIMHILSEMFRYTDELLQSSELNLTYDEFEVDACLKSMNIKIESDYTDFLQLLCDYVDVVSEVLGFQIFVFFHLKEYLEENELIEFYKHCNYRKIHLILCENAMKNRLDFEKLTIIDSDLCQIS